MSEPEHEAADDSFEAREPLFLDEHQPRIELLGDGGDVVHVPTDLDADALTYQLRFPRLPTQPKIIRRKLELRLRQYGLTPLAMWDGETPEFGDYLLFVTLPRRRVTEHSQAILEECLRGHYSLSFGGGSAYRIDQELYGTRSALDKARCDLDRVTADRERVRASLVSLRADLRDYSESLADAEGFRALATNRIDDLVGDLNAAEDLLEEARTKESSQSELAQRAALQNVAPAPPDEESSRKTSWVEPAIHSLCPRVELLRRCKKFVLSLDNTDSALVLEILWRLQVGIPLRHPPDPIKATDKSWRETKFRIRASDAGRLYFREHDRRILVLVSNKAGQAQDFDYLKKR